MLRNNLLCIYTYGVEFRDGIVLVNFLQKKKIQNTNLTLVFFNDFDPEIIRWISKTDKGATT